MAEGNSSFLKRFWAELFPKTYFSLKEPLSYARMRRDTKPMIRIMSVIIGLFLTTWLVIMLSIFWGEKVAGFEQYVALWLVLAPALTWGIWTLAPHLRSTVHVKENGFHRPKGKSAEVLEFADVVRCEVRRTAYRGGEFFVMVIERKKAKNSFFQGEDWQVGIPIDFPIKDLLEFLLKKEVPVTTATTA